MHVIHAEQDIHVMYWYRVIHAEQDMRMTYWYRVIHAEQDIRVTYWYRVIHAEQGENPLPLSSGSLRNYRHLFERQF
jgi:alkylated DNA nucleotide flippase Atl1